MESPTEVLKVSADGRLLARDEKGKFVDITDEAEVLLKMLERIIRPAKELK